MMSGMRPRIYAVIGSKKRSNPLEREVNEKSYGLSLVFVFDISVHI
jgi:hypothetical protein